MIKPSSLAGNAMSTGTAITMAIVGIINIFRVILGDKYEFWFMVTVLVISSTFIAWALHNIKIFFRN